MTPYDGFKIFKGGVLDRKMLRGFQHRSMAISLPFVLHRLLVDDDGVAEGAAVAYILWRNELDAVVFQESVPFVDADVLGLGGLDNVERLGAALQERMNTLSRLVTEEQEDITCKYAVFFIVCLYLLGWMS